MFGLGKKKFTTCWACDKEEVNRNHYKKTARNRITGKISRKITPYECPNHPNQPVCACGCTVKGFKTKSYDFMETEIKDDT